MTTRKRQKIRAILKRLNKSVLDMIDTTVYYDSGFREIYPDDEEDGSPAVDHEERDYLRLCEQLEKASTDVKAILEPKKKGRKPAPPRRVIR